LSTGAYRFPMDQAARIAIDAAIDFVQRHDRPELIRFVLFDAAAYRAFAAALAKSERDVRASLD
jgi:O-acetyl-ADP-ribose deacetylase